MSSVWTICGLAISTVFWVELVTWWIPGHNLLPVAMFLVLLTFIPICSIVGQLVMRTRTLARELMLPVERGAYLRQFGLAVALKCFQAWIVTLIVAAVSLLLVLRYPLPPGVAASFLALSASVQVCGLGLLVLLAKSVPAWLALLRGALIPLLMLILDARNLFEWQYTAWAISASLLLLGLLLTCLAYRRWLVADID